MTKYANAVNTGKGFITHEDIEKDGLSFVCLGNLIKITGDEIKINNWIKRAKGIEMDRAAYELEKAILEKNGLIQTISKTQKELSEHQTKLDAKIAFINTKKIIL